MGLDGQEGVLTNCSEYSRFSMIDQEMVSSWEQSSQESSPGQNVFKCSPDDKCERTHLSLPLFLCDAFCLCQDVKNREFIIHG